MALNLTFDGFAYFEDDSISSSNISYQAYFYKSNAGSSSSTWNTVRIVENTGYYNINLGNGDWLGQDGSASAGDIIIIVFWSPTTAGRLDSCSSLTQWGAFRAILDGSSVYTNDVQIKSNIPPLLDWFLPSSGTIGESIVAVNNSIDQHHWVFGTTDMYQRSYWYTSLMNLNSVDFTSYNWGDGNQDNNLSGTPNKSHQWSSSGNYNVEIIIEDSCGATVTGTKSIQIFNNAPINDIVISPPTPDPNEVVSFSWSGSDSDNCITSIDWIINDSGSYGNTDTTISGQSKNTTVYHTSGTGTSWCGQSANSGAFTNPGVHLVEIIVYYDDGFNTQSLNYSESFTQSRFSGPTLDFSQLPAQATLLNQVEMSNDSMNVSRVGLGPPDCGKYDWYVIEDGIQSSYLDKEYSYSPVFIAASTNTQIKLCANWSDGWDTQETCVTKDLIFSTNVSVEREVCYYNLDIIGTSSDGSISGYSWTVFSGISDSGPWTEVWTSPTGTDQQFKKISFAYEGWYKIEGYVYGTGSTTSDYDTLYISEVCVSGTNFYPVDVCPPVFNSDGIGGPFLDVQPPTISVLPSDAKRDSMGRRTPESNIYPDPFNL